MKGIFFTLLLAMACLVYLSTGCRKTASYHPSQASDYLPLFVGKYITYRLDSLEYINFGTQDTIVSYLAKDSVEAAITDNLGRPSFRVVRYLSDTTGTMPWVPSTTFLVTATTQDVEWVDNNMRFIKLVSPVEQAFNWQGNSYIDTRSAFSQFPYLDGWTYWYDSVGKPFATPNETVQQTVTVHEANDSSGILSDTVYNTRTFSEEVYGKGIGLIYRNFLHAEYQPPNISVPVGSTSGYGLRLIMVSHN